MYKRQVKGGGIDDDVIMNMVLIHMGTHHKGMIALCQLQCELPPDLVRFFRRDFAGLEGLPEAVSYTHLDVYKRQMPQRTNHAPRGKVRITVQGSRLPYLSLIHI